MTGRKPRSAVALQMILTRKGGPHRDRRKESRTRARQSTRKIEQDESY